MDVPVEFEQHDVEVVVGVMLVGSVLVNEFLQKKSAHGALGLMADAKKLIFRNP